METRSRLMTQLLTGWVLLSVLAHTLIARVRPPGPTARWRTGPASTDQRGLSQSTEAAILLAGAVAIAGLVIAAVTAYVQGKLPR